MGLALGLLLAAAVDGPAVVRHASALAALGPHPSGSPRARAAAEFVAAELRDAGLPQVTLQEFESGGRRGVNVVGVLPGTSPERVVVVAHHDTPEGSPGAHEAASGTGLLVELARVFSLERERPRTLVFLSLDRGPGAPASVGGAAYLAGLGADARNLVGVLAVGPLGRKGSGAVLHSLAAADRGKLGALFIAPGWWARAATEAGARAGTSLPVGDTGLLRWVYPAAVRTYRPGQVRGDDSAFLAAGRPGLWITDWVPTAPYPWPEAPTDTPDRLDAEALTEAGLVTQNIIRGLLQAPPGRGPDPSWVVVFGRILGPRWLLAAGLLALTPALVAGLRAGGALLYARLFLAGLSGLLLWRQPVVALFVLALPNLLAALGSFRVALFGFVPSLVLVAIGLFGVRRGLVSGLWLAPWELAAFGLALALALVPLRAVGAKKPVFKKIGVRTRSLRPRASRR